MNFRLCWLAVGLGLATGMQAQTATYTDGRVIPDNNGSGLSSTRSFSSPFTSLTDINLTLNISGGFNGDLFATLQHGSGFAVALNRVGRSAANLNGYPDSGFSVTIDDEAAADIHNYRVTLNPGGGALTGSWQPDGRNVDPNVSLDTSPRTAPLTAFDGLNPNGDWTLFIADVAALGQGTLTGWGLTVVGIPEPSTWVLATLGGLGLLMVARKWRKI